MVGIGFAMVGLGLWALVARLRGGLYRPGLLHRAAIVMGPMGFVAVLAGWITTEMGRQPYTVYGLLKTIDSASPLDAPAVSFSLAAFVVVYFFVFGAGVFYLMKLMGKTPEPGEAGLPENQPTRTTGITPTPPLRFPGESTQPRTSGQ